MKTPLLIAPALTDTLTVFGETFGPLAQALRPEIISEDRVHLHHQHVGEQFTLTHLGQRMIAADFRYGGSADAPVPFKVLMTRAERFVSAPVVQTSMKRLVEEGFPELTRGRMTNRTGLGRHEMRLTVPGGTLLLAGRFVGTQFSLGGTVIKDDPKRDPALTEFLGLARVEYTAPEQALNFTVKLAELRQAAGY